MVPLYVAAALQGFGLWVPIEKLFMNEIGFDAASVGLMAAAYAALVPIVEIPSGILADRWSRRGVLILASAAMFASTLIGGLSTNVVTYIVSALVLGFYFAMYSGTMDSIVYDTVFEETGDSDAFEKQLGRVRVVESSALVTSALLGGWLASLTSPRLTYFLTLPFLALSVVAYLRFREPQLHKAREATSVRDQIALTYRTLLRRGQLLPIVALTVLTALILQVVIEFGPLWLLALSASAVLYGPFWAGVMSSFGVGGLIAGRLRLERPAPFAIVVGLMLLASLTLTSSRNLLLISAAQVVLAILVVVVGIYVSRQLHDGIPSEVRAGVASGVGAISWIAFLPFALTFGVVSKDNGVHTAGWMIVGAVVLVAVALVAVTLRRAPAEPEPEATLTPVEVGQAS